VFFLHLLKIKYSFTIYEYYCPISSTRPTMSTQTAPDASQPAELISHLLDRYHAVHRVQLPELQRLARKVESVHADHPEVPRGLAEHLAQMESELLSHMEKEEQVLFPLMIKGGHPMIRHPIAMMRHEHDDHASALAELERLSHGMVPPAGACNSWRSLYQGLAQLRDDLQQHIRLENELLFPAFEPASQAAGGCGGGHCGCGG
jgi:regulator of cell morphogenesis and NO signaling